MSALEALPGWGTEWRSSQLCLIITCCIASFSDVFVYSALAPILTFDLPSRANVRATEVQTWVAVIPSLICGTTVVSAPFAGWLSDNLSLRRQPFFMFGLLVQAAGISLFMVGSSLAFWISGAILIGLASAVVWTSCLAIMIDTVAHSQLGRYTGCLTFSLGAGIFCGPVLGGVLYEYGGSYSIWGLCFGFVAVDAAMRVLMIERPRESPPVVGHDVKGSAASAESSPGRLKALHLLKSPRLLSAFWGTIVASTILSSFDGSLTIHARDTFQWGSTAVGLLYIPFIIPDTVHPLVGHLADKGWSRHIAPTGFLLGIPMLTCLRFVEYNSIGQKILLCALLFLTGLSTSPMIPVFSAEVTHVVLEYEKEHPGFFGERGAIAQAQGLWYSAFSIGATIGPLWGGLLQGAVGWKTMTWTLALLAGATAFPSFIFTNGTMHARKKAPAPVAEP